MTLVVCFDNFVISRAERDVSRFQAAISSAKICHIFSCLALGSGATSFGLTSRFTTLSTANGSIITVNAGQLINVDGNSSVQRTRHLVDLQFANPFSTCLSS